MSFMTDIIQPFEIKNYHTADDVQDNDYREKLINSVFDISTKKLHHCVNEYKSKVDSSYEVKIQCYSDIFS